MLWRTHGDLEKVQELLVESPSLLHASYNWGGSDWESALGASAHVGRKDIALYLLEKGARMDIFAAMLGELEVVQAILVAQRKHCVHPALMVFLFFNMHEWVERNLSVYMII